MLRRITPVYVLPTRYGTILSVGMVALLLGALNHNNNMGILLAFLLFAMWLVSAIHTHRHLTPVRPTRIACGDGFAGKGADLSISAETDRDRTPAIRFSMPSAAPRTIDIGADDGSVRLRIQTPARGLFAVGAFRMETTFPTGLFRAWSVWTSDQPYFVYPAPMPAAEPRSSGEGDGVGGTEIAPAAGADDFIGIFPFQPGDSLKHVDWKALSRGQGLQTKRFGTEHGGAETMLDWYEMDDPDTERRLARLCFLALRAHAGRRAFGLRMPGITIAPDTGDAHLCRCLRALALYK